MTEILRVFEDIFTKEEYCVLCLRSASERRMVDTTILKDFIQSCNMSCHYFGQFQRVCWVCSRAAAAAGRVRRAAALAGSVHGLFGVLQRAPERAALLAAELAGGTATSSLGRRAARCDRELSSVRACSVLSTTDVLIVAVPQAHDKDEVVVIPESPPPAPAVVDPPPRANNHSEPKITVESIIIDDDQDPISLQQPSPRNTTLSKQLKNIAPQSENSFLLHPIVNNQGVITVPTLNGQIINGQLMCIDKSNIVIQTPTIAIPDGQKLNIVTERDHILDFLSAKNNELPKMMNPAILSSSAMLSNPAILSSVIFDSEQTSVETQTEKRRSDTRKKEEEEKRQKKKIETDWEDKIPMDVISYMDAADSNAEPESQQPMGIITNVQSLAENTHAAETLTEINDTNTRRNNINTGSNNTNMDMNKTCTWMNNTDMGIEKNYIRKNYNNTGTRNREAWLDIGKNNSITGINNNNLRVDTRNAGINDAYTDKDNTNAGINDTNTGTNGINTEINDTVAEIHNTNTEIDKTDLDANSVNTRKKYTNFGINHIDVGDKLPKAKDSVHTFIQENGCLTVTSEDTSGAITGISTPKTGIRVVALGDLINKCISNIDSKSASIGDNVESGTKGSIKRNHIIGVEKKYDKESGNSVDGSKEVVPTGFISVNAGVISFQPLDSDSGNSQDSAGKGSDNERTLSGISSAISGGNTTILGINSNSDTDSAEESTSIYNRQPSNKSVEKRMSGENTHQNVFSKKSRRESDVIDLC